ncbi:MAG: peptidase S41 [Candidatus Eisenbacteria bacterium]|nr:peptidase S41 [Candidatus Eisenbacteria bacterium]
MRCPRVARRTCWEPHVKNDYLGRLGRLPGLVLLLLASGIGAPSEAAELDGLSAAPSVPPSGADSVLRSTDLKADLQVLRRAYETLHPGLLRYNTPAQIDSAFDALEKEFGQDRTLGQAYLGLSLLAAKVKCGHTYPNFFNQAESVAAALFRSPRLPFYFRWLGDRMIVTRSFASEESILPGTEVLAINDVPVATILARLTTVARADGNNDAKRVADLEVQGTSRFEAFDIYWPLFFPANASLVTLFVRAPGDLSARRVTVPLVAFTDRLPVIEAGHEPANEGASEASPDGAAPIWEYRLLEDRIGYLRMPSWVLYNTSWDWKGFLEQTFASLVASGATDLVVDLRNNEGGSDVGDVLVSHLVTEPIPRQAVTRLVRYRRVPDDLLPYLDTWDPSFKDWGAAAIDSTDRFYRLRRDADDDLGAVITPSLPRFAGRLWVLVGAANSSATFEFAQTVRQNRLGLLVGQPTGGNQRGINGGAFFFLRLPRTGLELDLPLIGQFRQGKWPDAGLEPDLFVVPRVEDIAQGRDAELEAVRAEIRRRDGSGR